MKLICRRFTLGYIRCGSGSLSDNPYPTGAPNTELTGCLKYSPRFIFSARPAIKLTRGVILLFIIVASPWRLSDGRKGYLKSFQSGCDRLTVFAPFCNVSLSRLGFRPVICNYKPSVLLPSFSIALKVRLK